MAVFVLRLRQYHRYYISVGKIFLRPFYLIITQNTNFKLQKDQFVPLNVRARGKGPPRPRVNNSKLIASSKMDPASFLTKLENFNLNPLFSKKGWIFNRSSPFFDGSSSIIFEEVKYYLCNNYRPVIQISCIQTT